MWSGRRGRWAGTARSRAGRRSRGDRGRRGRRAAAVAVVGGVGVDQDAFGSEALGEVDLDAAEGVAVADEDDLAFDADAEFGEAVEVREAAVVGVDDGGGHVAGGRGAVEGGQDAGVVLVVDRRRRCGIGVDVFGRGAAEELCRAASKASIRIETGLFIRTL